MKENLLKVHDICKKYHIYYYLVMVLLIVADLVSKKVIEGILLDAPGQRIEVIKGFFDLSLVYNPGAFSGFLGNSLFGQIILTLLSLVCGAAMVFYFVKFFNKLTKFEKIGLALAIPGTLGNLVDRTLMVFKVQEGVIDFLEFDLGFMIWNTFNVADALLVVGIISFAIGYLIRDIKASKEKEKQREEFYENKVEETTKDENDE